MTADAQLRETAWHEAGHAVARHRAGRDFADVTIQPDLQGMASGSVSYASEESWDEVVMLLSGIAAQRLINPGCDEAGAASDYAEADRILAVLGLSRELAEAEAAALVEREYRVIGQLADLLLEEQVLPADEAAVILDSIDEGVEPRLALQQMRWRDDGVSGGFPVTADLTPT